MHPLLNYLSHNPFLGLISATLSAATTNAINQGLIPDGVEEVTMYIASLFGLGIAFLTLVAMIRKERQLYKEKHKK